MGGGICFRDGRPRRHSTPRRSTPTRAPHAAGLVASVAFCAFSFTMYSALSLFRMCAACLQLAAYMGASVLMLLTVAASCSKPHGLCEEQPWA